MAQNVSITMTAQSPADAAIEASNKKIKALETELRKVARASKEGAAAGKELGKETEAGGERAIVSMKSLGKAMGALFSIAAAKAFYDYVAQRNKELADQFGKSQSSLVEAISETGDDANAKSAKLIQNWVDVQLRKNPLQTESAVIDAFRTTRGLMPDLPGQKPRLDLALKTAEQTLAATAGMSPAMQEAITRNVAMREAAQPSVDDGERSARIAQSMVLMQSLGAAGPAALDKATRARSLRGDQSADETIKVAMAALAAAGTEGDSQRIAEQLPAMAQQLFSMRDKDTQQRMFPGIKSEQEALRAIASGQISADKLREVGLISSQQAPQMRNMQRNFASYEQLINQADAATLGRSIDNREMLLGAEKARREAQRDALIQEREAGPEAARREAEKQERRNRAVEQFGPFIGSAIPDSVLLADEAARNRTDDPRGKGASGSESVDGMVWSPGLQQWVPDRRRQKPGQTSAVDAVGMTTESEAAGRMAATDATRNPPTNISINITDGIPSAAEVY